MLRTVLALFLVSLASVGCGGDDPTGPVTGPMTALIDGERFVAEFATVQRAADVVYVNGAGAGQRAIGFAFQDDGPGTYTLGQGNPVSVGVQIGNDTWSAGAGVGSGAIVVTTFTETRLVGTFAFTVGSGGSTLTITEGAFDIEFGGG